MLWIADALSGKAESVFLLLQDELNGWVDFLERKGYRVFSYHSKAEELNDSNSQSNDYNNCSLKNDNSDDKPASFSFARKFPGFQSLAEFYREIRSLHPIYNIREFVREIKIIRNYLSTLNPKIVVVYSDRAVIYRTLVTYASKMLIPSLVVPSTSAMSFPEGHGLSKVNRRSMQCGGPDAPVINRILAKLWPDIVYEYRGKKLLLDNTFRVIAEKLLGVYPKHPSIIGGGGISYIAVSGLLDWQRYVNYGVDKARLMITGLTVHDKLFSLIETRKKVKVKGHSNLVVLTVPALPEHNMLSWDEHIRLLRKVIIELQQTQCRLMLSLHPAHHTHYYLTLADEMGLEVSSKPLLELIPEMYLFICSHSSTIPWAILSGVPVMNLDIFGTEFDTYYSSEGIINITKIDEIASVMGRILDDKNYYQQLANYQLKTACSIGIMDGHSGDRLVSLVQDLMDGREPHLPVFRVSEPCQKVV
jgi:hypothetical protein